jgi:hypothetical protein
VRIEPTSNPCSGAIEQRPIVALDHRHARAHHACQLKDSDASGERVGSKRGAQVIDACWFGDAGAGDRGRPFAAAEVVQVEQPALGERRRAGGRAWRAAGRGLCSHLRGVWRRRRWRGRSRNHQRQDLRVPAHGAQPRVEARLVEPGDVDVGCWTTCIAGRP